MSFQIPFDAVYYRLIVNGVLTDPQAEYFYCVSFLSATLQAADIAPLKQESKCFC